MTQEHHKRATELFQECLSLAQEEREAFLDKHCGDDGELRRDVEGMLIFDSRDTQFLQKPIPFDDIPRRTPSEVGPFRIISVLGEGGMGTVYEAEQDRPQRRVALKVMRPLLASSSLLRRFDAEVQTLGRLQHKGIAQIFEAGTYDDGFGPQPYFAMELVRGVNLNDHVTRLRMGTREKLELMMNVCEAVCHAHDQGIIHRDLKPQNILVDEKGQPKILDFGIAKATDSDMQTMTSATDVGQIVGTLAYMSPEQVAADPTLIDARSDVYSLGVITYELLCGLRPYDVLGKPVHQAARSIQEDEPRTLSSFDRNLRGDVEIIVLKALEKEKDRRYATARAMADDIFRYLRAEPIIARPVTQLYRLRKFTRRNKALVGGTAGVFLALILGLLGTAWQAMRAEDGRHEAEVEAGRVRSVLDFFLSGMMSSVNPWEFGRDVRMVTVLDKTADSLNQAFIDSPEIEIEVRLRLGTIYKNLGFFDKARPQLERALALRENVSGKDETRTLDIASRLGDLLVDLGELDLAKDRLEPLLLRCESTLGLEHQTTLLCAARLASLYQQTERLADAEQLHKRTLETRVRLHGPNHLDTLSSKLGLANTTSALQRFEESKALLLEVYEGRIAALGEKHPNTLAALQALARSEMALGRFSEAEKLYRTALNTLQEVLGDEHIDTLDALNDLGGVLHETRGPEAAEPYYRRAVETGRKVLGQNHPALANFTNNLGSALEELARLDEAKALYLESLDVRERVYGSESRSVATVLNNLGTLHHRLGRLAEAESYYREAIDVYQALDDLDESVGLAKVESSLGALLYQRDQKVEAEEWYREAVRTARAILPDDHPLQPVFESQLGWCLASLSRFDEAEPLLLLALENYRRMRGDQDPDVRLTLERLTSLYRAWNKRMEAEGFQAQLNALGQ